MIKRLIYILLLATLMIGIVSKNHKVVSYEFITTCKDCGYKLAEGYHSFADGYKSIYCSECTRNGD